MFAIDDRAPGLAKTESSPDMIGLCLVILALWLACEICGRDLAAAKDVPPDPYRLDRWREAGDASSPRDKAEDPG